MPTHFSLQLVFFFFLLSSPSIGTVRCDKVKKHERKLFVFGDSYVDTGNWDPSISPSWKFPYGITFPGKPSGRFSDGRIITDYLASYLKIRSPIPYERGSKASKKEIESGMNFAYGGTGVFDTLISLPNLTTQIGLFENVLAKGTYFKHSHLPSSVALVSVSGNDYGYFIQQGRPLTSLPEFTKTVINQLVEDLKLIHSSGVSNILVLSMPTFGCIPAFTINFRYKICSKTFNDVAVYHNSLLQESLVSLNRQIGKSVFYLLDVYTAFQSSLMAHNPQQGTENLEYENPLKPCCQGISMEYQCGSIRGNQTKYTLCNNPQQAFFWDYAHPTQNGWHKVFLRILPTLRSIF